MPNDWDEVLVAREVTYSLEVNGKLFLIENVPARVNLNTGGQRCSPHKMVNLIFANHLIEFCY